VAGLEENENEQPPPPRSDRGTCFVMFNCESLYMMKIVLCYSVTC
jgi:hypothetical protein